MRELPCPPTALDLPVTQIIRYVAQWYFLSGNITHRNSPSLTLPLSLISLHDAAFKAHDTYKVLATLHRKMNGTGWPRRGGWDSYLVRRSRVELDGGRVYGIKSKDGRVELLVLSCNKVYGRIPPTIARLESLKCINLSDNHISGPIPVELGSLLQLQTLQLQGNNLRGIYVRATLFHHLGIVQRSRLCSMMEPRPPVGTRSGRHWVSLPCEVASPVIAG